MVPEDRLEHFETKLQRKKRHGTQLLWVTYNPQAEYKYDLVDAREDIEWMVSEIKRLREENASLREGLDVLREQMQRDLNSATRPESGRNGTEA